MLTLGKLRQEIDKVTQNKYTIRSIDQYNDRS